jgi:hypothetical protein
MKLSIEATVAAGVAVAFAALSIGAIAQEQSQRITGYDATGSPSLSQMSLQGSQSSLSGQHDGTGESEVLGLY